MTGEPVEADEIPAAEEGDDQRSLMELVERFGRDSSVLVLREAELAGARHETDVRRAGRDATAAAVAAVALGTAFLLANWAAVRGLWDRCRAGARRCCSRPYGWWWQSRWLHCRCPGSVTC